MRSYPDAFRFACYYGRGQLEALRSYGLAILQANHYSADEIAWLERMGTRCIAYLSIGETPLDRVVPHWCIHDARRGLPAVNERWQTAYVDCRNLAWQEQLLDEEVPRILQKGFGGLFLDTIDVQEIYPETRVGVVQLLARLRLRAAQAFLVANRGFSVLPTILPHIDAIVFEAFTSYYDGSRYAAWKGADLVWTAQQAESLRSLGADRPILALDYAAPDDSALRSVARLRAQRYRFQSFVGPSSLDWLPPETG